MDYKASISISLFRIYSLRSNEAGSGLQDMSIVCAYADNITRLVKYTFLLFSIRLIGRKSGYNSLSQVMCLGRNKQDSANHPMILSAMQKRTCMFHLLSSSEEQFLQRKVK